MRYSELEKLIKQAGCYILKEGANHSIWYSNQSKRRRGSSDPRLPRHLKGD